MEVLDPKDFNKKETYIDAPIDTEKNNFTGAKTDVGDDSAHNLEDDAIIDGKALYKNFNDLMEKEKLTIIKQSHGRRDGIHSGINRDEF